MSNKSDIELTEPEIHAILCSVPTERLQNSSATVGRTQTFRRKSKVKRLIRQWRNDSTLLTTDIYRKLQFQLDLKGVCSDLFFHRLGIRPRIETGRGRVDLICDQLEKNRPSYDVERNTNNDDGYSYISQSEAALDDLAREKSKFLSGITRIRRLTLYVSYRCIII